MDRSTVQYSDQSPGPPFILAAQPLSGDYRTVIRVCPHADLHGGHPGRAGTVHHPQVAGGQQDALAGQLTHRERLVHDLRVVVRPPLVPVAVQERLDPDLGLAGQGGGLATRLDLSLTEQVRVYRRLMLHQLGVLAPLADRVLVPVVAGNHDEITRQWATRPSDSWAIDGASAVADALAAQRAYRHVQFLFPADEELSVTVDVGPEDSPLVLGFTHGHVCGSTPNQVIPWWTRQSHGRQQAGEADVLFTGHWHHLRTEFTGGGRTWIMIPALDGGSEYYRRRTGEDTPAGMLSVWLTPGRGCGWEGLTIHA